MKRWSVAETKLKRQKIDFFSDLRYGSIEDIAKKEVEAECRRKRLDIIVKMNIKKGKSSELPDGSKISVRFIRGDGIIILDNWDELDVLLVFPLK